MGYNNSRPYRRDYALIPEKKKTSAKDSFWERSYLFSPVPPKSHIEPLLYRDDETGAHG